MGSSIWRSTRRSFDVAQVRGRGATPREGACLLACIKNVRVSAQTNHLGLEKHVACNDSLDEQFDEQLTNSALKAAMRAAAAQIISSEAVSGVTIRGIGEPGDGMSFINSG